jgi:4-hydroxybenzoate polyprenyltransferase
MWLANLPFGYMYVVRLRTPVRAISLVLLEWVPVALALKLVYSASLWITASMLAGNFALYECGYLINDLAD